MHTQTHTYTDSLRVCVSMCGPVSNGNEEVLYVPQSCRTGASPSDALVSYPGHLSYPSAEMQTVYSTAPTEWFGQ